MKRSGSIKPRGRVIWDEENLDFLEACKTPKQKITEPKTPYYAPDIADGVVSPSPDDERVPMETAIHAEAIRHALAEVASSSGASSSRQRGSSSGWTSSEDEFDDLEHYDEGLEANGRRQSFEEHRRIHYDEYRKAKMLRVHSEAEEDDSVGERPREGRHGGGASSSTSSSSSKRALDLESTVTRDMGAIDLQEKTMASAS